MNLHIPLGTSFEEPDDLNRVQVSFPDKDSAVLFYEWFKQKLIDMGAFA